MKIFSVMDTKAGTFLRPMSESNLVHAIRAFEVACNEPSSTFNRYPDDFSLFELAEFDVQTGTITPLVAPQNICTARSLIKQAPVQQVLPMDTAKGFHRD